VNRPEDEPDATPRRRRLDQLLPYPSPINWKRNSNTAFSTCGKCLNCEQTEHEPDQPHVSAASIGSCVLASGPPAFCVRCFAGVHEISSGSLTPNCCSKASPSFLCCSFHRLQPPMPVGIGHGGPFLAQRSPNALAQISVVLCTCILCRSRLVPPTSSIQSNLSESVSKVRDRIRTMILRLELPSPPRSHLRHVTIPFFLFRTRREERLF